MLATLFVIVGPAAGDEKILKPTPKDLLAASVAPYTGKKVEVKGRLSKYGVDNKSKKWFFQLTLIDDKDKDTTTAVYLFFDDMDAAAGLKDKLEALAKEKKVVTVKDRPVVVVRGVCETYADLDPKAKAPPVILNGTEIVELKEKAEKK
ncbi:MAG: hypothetical protein MUF18_19595 [Fimbriiglobus sp.]|nr:hypothetical protein [Fimbriiglobus sp.]